MKRRIAYIILTMILLTGLTGCGHKAASKSASSSDLHELSSGEAATEDTFSEKQEHSRPSESETQISSTEGSISENHDTDNKTVDAETTIGPVSLPPNSHLPSTNGTESTDTCIPSIPESPKKPGTDTVTVPADKPTSSVIRPSVINPSVTPATGIDTTKGTEKPTKKPAERPTNKPQATETTPQATTTPEQIIPIQVSISISCSDAVNNPSLKPGISLPADGIILNQVSVTLSKGSTVYAALEKACSDAGIPYEFTGTAPRKNIYISSISGLSQMDCGRYSGWKYSVNGQEPSVGCSMYILSDGDIINWHYATTL